MDRKQMVYHFICEDDYKPLKGKEMALLFACPKKKENSFMIYWMNWWLRERSYWIGQEDTGCQRKM